MATSIVYDELMATLQQFGPQIQVEREIQTQWRCKAIQYLAWLVSQDEGMEWLMKRATLVDLQRGVAQWRALTGP